MYLKNGPDERENLIAYRRSRSLLFQGLRWCPLASVTITAKQVIHFPAFNSLVPEILFEIVFCQCSFFHDVLFLN